MMEEVYSGIYRIDFPIPILQNPNIYLLPGHPLTLIDAAIPLPECQELLKSSLEKLHLRVSDIERVILTHTHPDHIGLASWIQREAGAEIYVHEAELFAVTKYSEVVEIGVKYMMEYTKMWGVIEKVREAVTRNSRWGNQFIESAQAAQALQDGDLLEAGNFQLIVVHTPGHSRGTACFYEENQRIIFTGDALLPSSAPLPDMYVELNQERISGLPDCLDSLKKIEDLEIKRAFPGHRKTIYHVKEVIENNRQYYSEQKEIAFNLFAQDKSYTLFELNNMVMEKRRLKKTFPNTMMTIAEVLGYVEKLEDEGKIRSYKKNGIIYYSRLKT